MTASTAVGGVEPLDGTYAEATRTGLCWSPCHNPTTDGRHMEGRGRVTLSGLVPGTIYYVRGFIETGAGTTYGSEVSFTTADSLLTVPEGAAKGLFSVGEGRQVYFSKGSEKNVKLTTVEDIDIFKALLAAQRSYWLK